ncbi:hypothetical protein ABKN59_010966 [Abortiporus biennis]
MVSTSKNFDLGKLDRAIIFIIWFSGLAGVQKTKTVTLVLVTKKIFVNLFKPSHQSWTSTTSTFDYVYKEHRKNIYLSIQSSIHRIGITYTKSSRSARGCRNLKKERAPVYYFYLPTYIMIYNMRCDAIYKNETPNPDCLPVSVKMSIMFRMSDSTRYKDIQYEREQTSPSHVTHGAVAYSRKWKSRFGFFLCAVSTVFLTRSLTVDKPSKLIQEVTYPPPPLKWSFRTDHYRRILPLVQGTRVQHAKIL